MLGGFCYIQKQANNSTIIQLDIKNHAFLRNISDKISAFLWSASSIMCAYIFAVVETCARPNLFEIDTLSTPLKYMTTQAANKLADVSRSVVNFIGKIPLVKEGPVDEFLIDVGDSISDAEKKQLEKTLAFFIQYKDSGLTPIAEHITTINRLSNTPVVMLYNKKVLCFHELKVS